MTVDTAYFALMCVGLGFMLIQILVKNKNLVHLLFAVFCGSMAMVAAQELSSNTLGPFRYLFGLAACATCNGMWLLSKALFSGAASVSMRHVVFAVTISLLVVLNNALHMAFELAFLEPDTHYQLTQGLGEFINLMSSTVLALTCWEAAKDLPQKSKPEFGQRVLFMTSFGFGFILCTVFAKSFFNPEELTHVFPWLMSFAAIQMMVVTQAIMWWKQRTLVVSTEAPVENELPEIDPALIAGINTSVRENKGYLTHNLKIVDLAHELNVSEYKISRAIRHHFGSPNFNHFINSLRLSHATDLMNQNETKDWSILVISMESGFSSLATFNRVFKAQFGYAPNKHRKNLASTI